MTKACAVAIALALAALAGCDDTGPSQPEATRSSTESATGSATGSATADRLTAPGSTLDFGETATVTRADGAGTMRLTVNGIEAGDPAELAATGYEDAEGRVPYYVRFTVEHVDGRSPNSITALEYLSVWAGGTPLDHLSVFEPFASCQEAVFPVDAIPGATIESCATYTAEQGAPPPDAVMFDNDDTYESADDGQITWR